MSLKAQLAGLAVVSLFAVAAVPAAVARTTPPRPSERACLIAWNASGNRANRARVAADGPWSRSSLMSGVVGTVAFRRGGAPKQTSAVACLLMLGKAGRLQPVTGIWRGSGVGHWSFRRMVRTENAPPANVRVLADGRVTKIYRR